MTKDKLLTVKNLHTTFHTDTEVVHAVKGVSFDLYRGETLGIVGESGSGKSVTALSIMRLIPSPGQVEAGTVSYYPEAGGPAVDLRQLKRKEMRRYRGMELAMIFQEPMSSLNPVFRCGEQVIEGMRHHLKLSRQEARARALQWFEEVQLPNPERIYQAYPHQLSGGQKQRVMIAMAMSCNPGLLIADEPTTALDVTVQKAILELMGNIKTEHGSSIMFITHDLGVISEIADRVLVMFKGQIVEEGRVEELFANPRHPYTKSLLACRPPLNYRLRRLPVVSDFMEVQAQEDGETVVVEKKATLESVIRRERIPALELRRRSRQLKQKPPILEVKGLKTWFPAQHNFWGKPKSYIRAVDDVSFEVYPGETLGLVGESGCGKTTLGRSLLGLAPVREGKVLYKGQSLLELSDEDWKPLR